MDRSASGASIMAALLVCRKPCRSLSWPACLSVGGAVGSIVPCGSRFGLSWHRGPAIPSRSAPLCSASDSSHRLRAPLHTRSCRSPNACCNKHSPVPLISVYSVFSIVYIYQLSTFISSPHLSAHQFYQLSIFISFLSFLSFLSFISSQFLQFSSWAYSA